MTAWKKIRLLLLAGMIGVGGLELGKTVDPRLSRPDRERRGGSGASADARQRSRGSPAHNPAMRSRRLRLLGFNIRRTGAALTLSTPVSSSALSRHRRSRRDASGRGVALCRVHDPAYR